MGPFKSLYIENENAHSHIRMHISNRPVDMCRIHYTLIRFNKRSHTSLDICIVFFFSFGFLLSSFSVLFSLLSLLFDLCRFTPFIVVSVRWISALVALSRSCSSPENLRRTMNAVFSDTLCVRVTLLWSQVQLCLCCNSNSINKPILFLTC